MLMQKTVTPSLLSVLETVGWDEAKYREAVNELLGKCEDAGQSAPRLVQRILADAIIFLGEGDAEAYRLETTPGVIQATIKEVVVSAEDRRAYAETVGELCNVVDSFKLAQSFIVSPFTLGAYCYAMNDSPTREGLLFDTRERAEQYADTIALRQQAAQRQNAEFYERRQKEGAGRDNARMRAMLGL